jgi:hypothetical protein
MFGFTGNLIVVQRQSHYTVYHDDEQNIWNPADFNEGALKPAMEFDHECKPFEYGGMYYNRGSYYDHEKLLSKESKALYMFYGSCSDFDYHCKAKDDNIVWMNDNTVYKIALSRHNNKIIREPGPLVIEVKDFIRWNFIIPCHVSISMKGKLLHSSAECSKLLYVDGTFRSNYEKIQFTNELGKPDKLDGLDKLPEFTLILNLILHRFDDIIYAKTNKIITPVYTLANITIPEQYQLICPPNSNSIYIVDTDTGGQQRCQFVGHSSFYQMLLNIGFEAVPRTPPSLDLKNAYLKAYGRTLVRRGLYVQTDNLSCNYVSGYERSPNAGKLTKAALRDE